jgi:hypothetical protein
MSESECNSTDPFVEMERQHEVFMSRINDTPVVDLIGLVGASGPGGGSSGGEENWSLIFHCDDWRIVGSSVQVDELRVEMPVSKKALSVEMERINAYDIVHMRGRIADHPVGRKQALVDQIVSTEYDDAELQARATKLQKPVTVETSRFGILTLDRTVNWFKAVTNWADCKITLHLSMDDAESVDQLLSIASQLWDAEPDWDAKVRDYAIRELLPLKNGNWLEDDESELTAEDFTARMTIESITVYPNGSFEFWHDDGDLFLGHSIMVSGSISDGLDDADIHG